MKESSRIGINKYLNIERPEEWIRPNRELYREHRDEMVELKKRGIETEEDLLPLNMLLNAEYKTPMKTRDGFVKRFVVCEATINGKKKMVVFRSFSLAIKIMSYIKETYSSPKIKIDYILTQM